MRKYRLCIWLRICRLQSVQARRSSGYSHRLSVLSKRSVGARARSREADHDISARAYANITSCSRGQGRGLARCRGSATVEGAVMTSRSCDQRPRLEQTVTSKAKARISWFSRSIQRRVMLTSSVGAGANQSESGVGVGDRGGDEITRARRQ